MALPPLTDAGALGLRLGRTLTGADETRADAVIADVSALARKESGDSERWVSDDGTTATAPEDVVAVVLAAARRLFGNPNGFASEQDGDYSYRIDSDSLAQGGGVFTSAELQILNSYQDSPGLWSQKFTGAPDTTRTNAGLLERVWDATFAE